MTRRRPDRWSRHRAQLLGVLAAGIALGGCAAPGSRGRPAGDRDALRQRAERLWAARVAEDWATAYEFEDPQVQAARSRDEFVAWCRENEPFRIHEFRLGDVQCDRDMGWVEVAFRSSLRRFPKLDPHQGTRWEKWHRLDGVWYPVPRTELNGYPEAPAVRDHAQEQRLRARFDAAWDAQRREDWAAVHGLLDPEDRATVSVESLAREQSLNRAVACDVRWVEVVGGRGRILVVYEVKSNDPNMTKLPPTLTPVCERWVQRDGEWYRDVDASPARRAQP